MAVLTSRKSPQRLKDLLKDESLVLTNRLTRLPGLGLLPQFLVLSGPVSTAMSSALGTLASGTALSSQPHLGAGLQWPRSADGDPESRPRAGAKHSTGQHGQVASGPVAGPSGTKG